MKKYSITQLRYTVSNKNNGAELFLLRYVLLQLINKLSLICKRFLVPPAKERRKNWSWIELSTNSLPLKNGTKYNLWNTAFKKFY